MDPPPTYAPRTARALSSADFDTASIRSAAPSYLSQAPSYHSTLRSASSSCSPRGLSPASSYSPSSTSPPSQLSLAHFRRGSGGSGPTWSSLAASSNPTARHYHSVATRRASVAAAAGGGGGPTLTHRDRLERSIEAAAAREEREEEIRGKMKKEEDDEGHTERVREAEMMMGLGTRGYRALEDPGLVGEEEAARAREEREARERGEAVLVREDQRWDWLIGQMRDWDERERSWNKFKQEVSEGKRSKLARRIGLR